MKKSRIGESWHTAEWPDKNKISLKGKKIGMIGNGASAVQILPHLLDEAEVNENKYKVFRSLEVFSDLQFVFKTVVMFQRTAHYVFPRFQEWLCNFIGFPQS